MLINNILLSLVIIFLWSLWSVITYKVLKYISDKEQSDELYEDESDIDDICLSFFPGTLIIVSAYYFIKLNIRISNIIIDNIINMLLKRKNL